MQKVLLSAASAMAAALALASNVAAQENHSGHGAAAESDRAGMHESHGDHSGHMTTEASSTQAEGIGVVNSIDTEKGIVNLTHEPMPALGWPQMTMDMAVTKNVDLSGVKAGDKVGFTLKLGRDKQYRIVDMATKK